MSTQTATDLKSEFLLDPTVVFLNHGSFGACPKPVFETLQRWQLEMERQPVEFLGRRIDDLLATARAALGKYINSDPADLFYVPNATTGGNIVARSLHLQPGDEILTTNHEYGALNYTWEYVCRRTGAQYIHRDVPMPVTTHADMVEEFWKGVTPKTKVIFMSHITSPTALIFPIAEICYRARQAGILTVIDGAHAPGQIPLDMQAFDVDFYTGNCHKWMCAPKGSGFLYVRRELQSIIEPLVVSWGYTEESDFVTKHQWQGTRDASSYLTVPAAIEFQAAHNWDEVRQRCHELANETRRRIAELTGVPSQVPEGTEWYAQMVACPLPAIDTTVLKQRLYDDFRIEVPLTGWNGNPGIRVSYQGYNDHEDLEKLLFALGRLLDELT